MSISAEIRARGRRREHLPTPLWERDDLHVRALSAKERLFWEESSAATKKNGDGEIDGAYSMALLVRLALVDAEGKEVFSDADIAWLAGEADFPAVHAVYRKALEVNALGPEYENLEGNSEPAAVPAAASPSSSPSPTSAST